MDHEPALAIEGTFTTLQEAYEFLKIQNTSISDGDVVAAFYKVYTINYSASQRWSVKALEVIATRRRSPLLAFILTVIPSLTKDNVCLLATPSQTIATGSASQETNEQTKAVVHPIAVNKFEHVAPGLTGTKNLENTNSSESDFTLTPTSTVDHDIGTDHPDHISLPTEAAEEASSTSIGASSIEDDSADAESDFDEYISGKFWDGQSWRCEECNEELVDERCPNGHAVNPCRTCGQECGDYGARVCEHCHDDQDLKSSDHGSTDDESSSEDGGLVWDDFDHVWRCEDCHWEVEANEENEGHCHCFLGEEVRDPDTWRIQYLVRPIELLNFPEYEPADSDSSGPESVDSEPDSGDESFIEDDGPFNPGLLTLMGPLSPPRETEPTEDLASTNNEDPSAASAEPQIMDLT